MNSRLLVAYSDEPLLDVYQSFFWDRGFEVEVAANVAECLAMLPEFHPDVLVLQLELRGGSGDPILSHLRAASLQHSRVPVVLLTDNVHISDLGVFIDPPIYACLRMPTSLSTLLEAVRRARAERNGPERFLPGANR